MLELRLSALILRHCTTLMILLTRSSPLRRQPTTYPSSRDTHQLPTSADLAAAGRTTARRRASRRQDDVRRATTSLDRDSDSCSRGGGDRLGVALPTRPAVAAPSTLTAGGIVVPARAAWASVACVGAREEGRWGYQGRWAGEGGYDGEKREGEELHCWFGLGVWVVKQDGEVRWAR